MSTFKKIFVVTRYFVIACSFLAGFVIGAIFGDTVVNRFEPPTALTFYLAGLDR